MYRANRKFACTYKNFKKGDKHMKVIRNISAENAAKKLEQDASKKFVANETASGCLCRCSDG